MKVYCTTVERAIDEGVSADNLRQIADWNFKTAENHMRGQYKDENAAERCRAQGVALTNVANELERTS